MASAAAMGAAAGAAAGAAQGLSQYTTSSGGGGSSSSRPQGVPDNYVSEPARGAGTVWREPGTAGDANTVRIMRPGADARYPNGYRVYTNKEQSAARRERQTRASIGYTYTNQCRRFVRGSSRMAKLTSYRSAGTIVQMRFNYAVTIVTDTDRRIPIQGLFSIDQAA